MVNGSMCGWPEKSRVSAELRMKGCSRRVLSACVFSRKATVIVCGPALSGTRTVKRLSISSPVVVGLSLDARTSLVAAERREVHALAVDG